MTKTKESSLYEVQGKTKWRGETYHATKCATCAAPLSVMVERGQEYTEKTRYCSDKCELRLEQIKEYKSLIEAEIDTLSAVRDVTDNPYKWEDLDQQIDGLLCAKDNASAEIDAALSDVQGNPRTEGKQCEHAHGKGAEGKKLRCADCRCLFDPRNYSEVGQVVLYGNGQSLRGYTKNTQYEPENPAGYGWERDEHK